MTVEKRNARPYVLGFCFFWGLVLGFTVYRVIPSTAEITDREQKEERAKEEERQRRLAEERARTGATPVDRTKQVSPDIKPPITVAEIAPQPATDEDEVRSAAKSKDWRSVPQIAKVPLNPAYGLTARTSPLPVPPDKLDIRETIRRTARAAAALNAGGTAAAPAVPARPAPATKTEDLPMPEID